MNMKTTVIFVIIAAALVAYFLLSPAGEEAGDAGPEPGAGRPLVDDQAVGPNVVHRLTVDRREGPRVVFERDAAGEWRQTEPFEFPVKGPEAGGYNIGSIIDAAASLRYTRKLDDPQAPKTYDLDLPLATLRIEGAYRRVDGVVEPLEPGDGAYQDGRVSVDLRFKLGRKTAAGRAFVMFGKARRIYVTGRRLHRELLDQPLTELRQRSLADVTVGRVAKVELVRGDQPLTIEPGDLPGAWRFTGGAEGRASAEAVEGLARLLRNARIQSFIADQPADLARYGLDEPKHELVIHARPSTPTAGVGAGADAGADEGPAAAGETVRHRLRVGRDVVDGEGAYAMYQDRPVVFTLPSYVLDPLGTSLAELRDARLTPMPRRDARAVTVDRPDQPTLRIVKEAGEWRFGEPAPGFKVEPESVESLLDAVFDTRAASFVPAERFGEAGATLTIDFAGRADADVLRLARAPAADDGDGAGGPTGDRWWVLRAGEPVAGVVSHADMAALFRPMRFFRDRTVLDLRASRIVRLHVERAGPFAVEHVIARPRREDGTYGEWQYPDALRPEAVESLIDRLTPLRAERWVEAPPAKEAPSMTLELTTLAPPEPDAAGEGRERRVWTVSIHRDLKLATFGGEAFALSTPVLSALAAEFRERTVIGLEADQVARLRTPAGHVIERDPAGRYDWPDEAALTEQRAGALFDTLAGLQADRFFAPGVEPRGEPAASYVLEPRDGESITLDLFEASQTPADLPAGRIGDRLFTIDPPTAKTLMPDAAIPGPPPEPEK